MPQLRVLALGAFALWVSDLRGLVHCLLHLCAGVTGVVLWLSLTAGSGAARAGGAAAAAAGARHAAGVP